MPPAPSGAVDSAVKMSVCQDSRDAIRRERNDKSLSLKDPQHKLHTSDMYDHTRPGQSTSSPTNSKPRKIKKKKKSQKPAQSISQTDVEVPTVSGTAVEKMPDAEIGKVVENVVGSSTPPKDGIVLKDGPENLSAMELVKTRGDALMNGPKGSQESMIRKGSDSASSSRKKDSSDWDAGKRVGSHRREKKADREALKGSDSGSSGSAGIARNLSLAIVEEVLRDLPSGSLSRPVRKQDMGAHQSDSSMLPMDSPNDKLTGSSPSRDFGNVPGYYGSINAHVSSPYSRANEMPFRSKPQTMRIQDDSMQYGVDHDPIERLQRIDTSSSMTSHISQVHPADASTDCIPTTLETSGITGVTTMQRFHRIERLNAESPVGFCCVSQFCVDCMASEGTIGAVHREQLIFDMNDFNEEEVYIRRNRSGGSLTGSFGLPGTPGAVEANTESGDIVPSIAEEPGNSVPPDWWYGNNHTAPSPPLGRLNFRIANGLLHEHGQEEQQEHRGDEASSNYQRKGSGAMASYTRAPPSDFAQVGVPPGMDVAGMPDPNSANGTGNLAPMLFPRDDASQIEAQVRSINDAAAASFQVGSSTFVQNEVVSNQYGSSQHAKGSPGARGLPARRSRRSDLNDQSAYAPLPGALNDLDRLLLQATPMLQLDPSVSPKDAVENFTLDDVWNFYYEPSMFGREVQILGGRSNEKYTENAPKHSYKRVQEPFSIPNLLPRYSAMRLLLQIVFRLKRVSDTVGGNKNTMHIDLVLFHNFGARGPSSAYFLPYLSAIQVFMPTDDQGGYASQSDRVYVCDIDYWPKIMRLHFEQFESNPPWYRLPLHDTMNQLAESFPELKTMRLKDIHPASWFCVAWYPLYRIPDAPLATRFLTYHTFHPPLSNINTVYQGGVVPLPVYGLEWYNMKDEPQWMDNISLAKSPRSNGASVPNGSLEGLPQGEDVDNSWESHAWQVHVRELRSNAKKFARGIGLRKMTRRGIEEANTHHHDFEYFYERN